LSRSARPGKEGSVHRPFAQNVTITSELQTSTVPTNSVFAIGVFGDIAFVYGVVSACLLWGFGLVWLCLALQTIREALLKKGRPKFGMP